MHHIFLLSILIGFFGHGQKKLEYNSKFISFSYFDTFTLDSSTYYMDSSNKNVKLSCNSCDYGSLDNIMIIYLPTNDDKKINSMELFNQLKKDTESKMLKMGVISNFSLIKIGTELVNGISIPFIISQNNIKDLGITYQKLYIYQSTETYFIILTVSSKKDINKRQDDVNFILKTFDIKND